MYWLLFTSLVWEVTLLREYSIPSSRSLIRTLNSTGHGIDLRGISLVTSHCNKIFITIPCVWHSRQFFTHLMAYLASTHRSELALNILWEPVLMTLLKTRLTTPTALLHPQRKSSHLRRLSGWSVSAGHSQWILLFVFTLLSQSHDYYCQQCHPLIWSVVLPCSWVEGTAEHLL